MQRTPAPHPKPSALSWNDLHDALALARSGTLAGAARSLGLNHSTMFRRLNDLEARLGVRLFERGGGRFLPTDAGRQIVAAAERMEGEAQAAERAVAGSDLRLEGDLRVTASETLSYRILPPLISEFRQLHPGITVELMVENRTLDLGRREADVALRARRPRENKLFGRKLVDVMWGMYAAKDYVARRGRPRAPGDLPGHDFIGWSDTGWHHAKVQAWLEAAVPAYAPVYRTNGLVQQMRSALHGTGIATLPCYLADPEPDMLRLVGPIPEIATELWLVTHEDLKATARVRAFMDFLGPALVKQKAVFESRTKRKG